MQTKLKEDFQEPDDSNSLSESERQELLAYLLEEEGIDVDDRMSIQPRANSEPAPLSFGQQRLWFLNQLEPDSCAYHISGAIRMAGRLDAGVLERSINEIFRRHEILRTTFVSVDGVPFQIASPSLRLRLPVLDLTDMPEESRRLQCRRLMEEAAVEPFDLERGPLLRAKLVRMAESEFIFFLTMHHIISDGWSLDVFARELAVLYEAFSNDSPSPLPELPIQYADYAIAQRKCLQGDVLDQHLAYWKEKLGGEIPALQLPTDYPRQAGHSFEGETQSLSLSAALTDAIKSLSMREGATMFFVLTAAFKLLLSRYAGQQDIVIGAPFANRNRVETESLIGFFVTTLVLRTDLSGDPSFCELLRRVSAVCLEAYAHQDVPFEKLVDELQPERDLGRNPLFDVMINLFDSRAATIEFPGLTLSLPQPIVRESKFALTLYIENREAELDLRATYLRALFSDERMAHLLEQFEHLLEQIVVAPERPISSYSLVTARSKRLLPDPTAALPEPLYAPIPKLFIEWAKKAPGHVAVSQAGKTWTYEELSRAVTGIARALIARGLNRGDVIGISGQRSFGLAASMMAALACGGVMLTLDPGIPAMRRKLMLKEARAKWMLYVGQTPADGAFADEVPALVSLQVGPNDGRVAGGEFNDEVNPVQLPEPAPDDAAYVLFTSGTTGVPKGVLGCHKGLSHFLDWERVTFDVTRSDRFVQISNLSFDPILRDTFLPLSSGATLCLPEDADDLGSHNVLSWLERERITMLHVVPVLAQTWLLNKPSCVTLKALRWVLFAGEPLTDSLVRQWREAFPESGGIANLYGPTETTQSKAFQILPGQIQPGVQHVGRPLPHSQTLVMSPGNKLCGIGEVGEIVVRTPFRSLGYINSPEETFKRFFVNPYTDRQDDILYRSGDLGRYRLDGSLEVLGRVDHQVKVRGVRVEPEEVTAILARYPLVKSCVVVARADAHKQNTLVAYVVSKNGEAIPASELKAYLAEQVVKAMIPSSFVFLDKLPLTANGKVDRHALPAPDGSQIERRAEFVAPRNETESILAEIWAEVLNVDTVGVFDNFFSLGGDSLLSMQMVARANAKGLRLTAKKLFQHQTISELAKASGLAAPSAFAPDEELKEPAPRAIRFTPEQARFLQTHTIDVNHWNLNIPVLEVIEDLSPSMIREAAARLIRSHDALCLRFKKGRSGWEQTYGEPDKSLSFCVVDLSKLSEVDQAAAIEVAAARTHASLDLSAGPLVRFVLFNLGNHRRSRLLIVLPHLLADGYSRQVLIEDVLVACHQLIDGEAIQIPQNLTPFHKATRRLTEYARSAELQREADYWLDERRLQVRPLPLDHRRGENVWRSADTRADSLSEGETASLNRFCKRHSVQPDELLMTAVVASLAAWSGDNRALVDLVGHGRNEVFNEVDLSRTVGWFSVMFPVYLELEAPVVSVSSVMSIREQLRQVPKGGMGYELLRYLHPDEEVRRRFERFGHAEVSFNYLGQLHRLATENTPFRIADDLSRFTRSPRSVRDYLLDLSAVISDGRLQVFCMYSANFHDGATVAGLLRSVLQGLRALLIQGVNL